MNLEALRASIFWSVFDQFIRLDENVISKATVWPWSKSFLAPPKVSPNGAPYST